MLLYIRTSRCRTWLSVLFVVGVARAAVAQSEKEPSESDSPGLTDDSSGAPSEAAAPSLPVPASYAPAVAAFPEEPERAAIALTPAAPLVPVAAPVQTARSVANAEPRPIPGKHSAFQDAPFNASSNAYSSSALPVSEPPKHSSDEAGASDDLLRIGPVVGVGLPNLISIGGMVKLTSYLGGGLNVGLIPSTQLSFYGDATLSYQEYDVYGRLFPFGGGFFLGAGVGYVTITGTLKEEFDTSDYQGVGVPNPLVFESEGSVKTMVITPQIGYFYTMDVGFSIGLDLGAQVPIAPSEVTYKSKLDLPASDAATAIQLAYVDPNDKKVKETLETIGRTPLPTVNLKVGWLF